MRHTAVPFANLLIIMARLQKKKRRWRHTDQCNKQEGEGFYLFPLYCTVNARWGVTKPHTQSDKTLPRVFIAPASLWRVYSEVRPLRIPWDFPLHRVPLLVSRGGEPPAEE